MIKFTFRRATNIEESLVKNHIRVEFGNKATQIFFQKKLWIKDGKIIEVFLVHESLNDVMEEINENIYFAGIPIGSLWKNEFQLEIEGSLLILPYTEKIIKVKTNQFLYGKNIFVENIELIKFNFNKGDYLIIIGKNSLHFGIGKAEIGSEEIGNVPSNTILIKGLKNKPLDRGWYLRKGN